MKPNATDLPHTDGVTMSDSEIKRHIGQYAKNGKLPCALAFELVKKLNVSPIRIGKVADDMQIRLEKCQLGLFGYGEKKKLVTPMEQVPDQMRTAIEQRLANDRLPCDKAWEIADTLKIPKLSVSNACEAMGIKIKPCQLGAF